MISASFNQFFSQTKKKLWLLFLTAIVTIILLGVFQDFLYSQRNDISFYFSESLLFKSLWVLFPPIFILIKIYLQKDGGFTPTRMAVILILATLLHLILVPIIIWTLSTIFREQSYGLYKVFTFTLANDLLKIVVVYCAFIGLLKYYSHLKRHENKQVQQETNKEQKTTDYLTVISGKKSQLVKITDILFIQSATPYVAIQTPEKQLLHSATMKSILHELDSRFVRVHRSMIVNTEKVTSYQSRLNGDYDLTLEDGNEVRLSRNFVKDFKARFRFTPQLKT